MNMVVDVCVAVILSNAFDEPY